METQEMRDLIMSAKPGNKMKIVFADKNFNEDLVERVYRILAMCFPVGEAIDLGEVPTLNLQAVAERGEWKGLRTYTATVLDKFDAECFIQLTLRHNLLESVTKVTT